MLAYNLWLVLRIQSEVGFHDGLANFIQHVLLPRLHGAEQPVLSRVSMGKTKTSNVIREGSNKIKNKSRSFSIFIL
jgi:hypothetical protein